MLMKMNDSGLNPDVTFAVFIIDLNVNPQTAKQLHVSGAITIRFEFVPSFSIHPSIRRSPSLLTCRRGPIAHHPLVALVRGIHHDDRFSTVYVYLSQRSVTWTPTG